MTTQKQHETVKEMMALVVGKHKKDNQKQEAESMSERDKRLASSIAKKPRTEVQPVPVLKKKRARESRDSSSVAKKKLKTDIIEQVCVSGELRNEGIEPLRHNEKDLLASLPLHVSFMILDMLMDPVDHLRLALVCKEWSFISRQYNDATQRWRNSKGNLVPLFLQRNERSVTNLEAYTVSDKITRYDSVPSAVAYGKRCCGSSHGWLASVDLEGECLRVVLKHAFQKSADSIRLPPLKLTRMTEEYQREHLKEKYQEYIEKVVLSSDPNTSPNNYVVIVLYGYQGCKLAFIKGGEERWTYVDRRISRLRDAMFYRNQVYAVGGAQEKIVSFDVNGPPKVKQATRTGEYKGGGWIHNSYLVESASGEHVWHVRRLGTFSKRTGLYSERFKVYKVVFDAQDGSVVEQVKVESNGDEALFVGVSHSVSVLASNFPGSCKPNSIYYTNYDLHGHTEPESRPLPYRVFSLDEGSITCYHEFNSQSPEESWGVWVLPMFKGLC
ncbi:hypothetical protein ACLB2K_002532 [Fragaria x ananassa]